MLLAVGLLVLLWRRRALVVAVLRPAHLVSVCDMSRASFRVCLLLLVAASISSSSTLVGIVVPLAWVCHFVRCIRPSAGRKCSEQKVTAVSGATVQCPGGIYVWPRGSPRRGLWVVRAVVGGRAGSRGAVHGRQQMSALDGLQIGLCWRAGVGEAFGCVVWLYRCAQAGVMDVLQALTTDRGRREEGHFTTT